MALRSGHGKGRGTPHIEVLPADELPAPVPAEPVQPARRPDGTIADSEAARELGRRGGLAKAKSVRLVTSLGLGKLNENSAFASYRKGAEEFHTFHVEALAYQAGGIVGPAPNTMIATAALQLAVSRYYFDRFHETLAMEDSKMASNQGDASRQNLLAAYELAVKEANARKAAAPPVNALDAWMSPEEKAK